MISFATPAWLIALLLAPLAWLQWTRFGGSLSPRIKRRTAAVRTLIIVMLVLALAGVQWESRRGGTDVIVLVDASDSVQAGSSEDLAAEYYNALAEHLGPDDRLGLVAFGRDVVVIESPQQGAAPGVAARPDGSATDIERALKAVVALTDSDRNARILLLSDGIETLGSALTAATSLRPGGLPIDVVPLPPWETPEVLVESFALPRSVNSEEPFTIRSVLYSTHPTQARVYLLRDGLIVDERLLNLESGRTLIEYPNLLQEVGLSTYEIRLESLDDTFSQNNVGRGVVATAGASRVLLVGGEMEESAPLHQALLTQGIAVDLIAPHDLPWDPGALAHYQALILHNVSALQLSLSQMHEVQNYVRNGGGVVIVGGRRSFGLGGYRDTPLDTISPLQTEAPEQALIPSVAMVLVIDKSASMSASVEPGGPSKLDLAKEAVIGVAQSVGVRDTLGLLAFDTRSHWTVPLQPVTTRDGFAAQVLRLVADGGTDAYPALVEAHAALRESSAGVKHVILLSDGHTLQKPFESLVPRMRADSITISTVAVGDADTELLQRIARWGGGRYYYTDDPYRIPSIFAAETRIVSPPPFIEERVVPRMVAPGDLLRGTTEPLPPLDGYAVTHAHADATVHLGTEDGTPLLGSWRYGLGRVVAFAGGFTPEWGAEWLAWPAFPPLWAQIVRWSMRPDPTGHIAAGLDVHKGRGSLWVDALDGAGRYINFLELTAEVRSPAGEVITHSVPQVGPGRYELEFPAPIEGTWTATLTAKEDLIPAPIVTASSQAYGGEYEVPRPHASILTELARRTGGLVITEPDHVSQILAQSGKVRSVVPLWPWLVLGVAFLFMLDMGIRYVPPGTWAYARERWQERRERRRSTGPTLAEQVEQRRAQERKTPPVDARQAASREAHAFLARRRKERQASSASGSKPAGE